MQVINDYLRKWCRSIYSLLCGYCILGSQIRQYSYKSIKIIDSPLADGNRTSKWSQVFGNGVRTNDKFIMN